MIDFIFESLWIAMIPTCHKSRIRKTLSYPIGAEVISKAFAGVPQLEQLQLWFCGAPIHWKSQFDRLIREGHPYSIFQAKYRRETNYGYAHHPASWMLTVYPVVREQRHMASELLRNGGLATVVEWFHNANLPGWTNTSHHIDLLFDPKGKVLSVERHNGP